MENSTDNTSNDQCPLITLEGIDVRERKTPTRLELHRLRFNKDGRRGNLLRVSELDRREKDILNREIAQDVRVKRIDFTGDMDEQIFDEVQMQVFSEWGVMCPHSVCIQAEHKQALKCTACGCLMFSVNVMSEVKSIKKASE